MFAGQLPYDFVNEFVHWYDDNRHEVIFRRRKNPWSSEDSVQWRLLREDSFWRLVKGADVLVNISSNCARTLSQIFRPLEDKAHIHIIFKTLSGRTEINLPRLQLSFYMVSQENKIHSEQYRGMAIDCDQRIGALVGLRNKLVLRNMSGANDRLVLIPEGIVEYTKTSSNKHVMISIDKDTITKVHAYSLDTYLGRLTDNGDLQSKLVLCYLYALTSSFLPDPLTGYTGTESALAILKCAAVRSFESLTDENISLLTRIAMLSPGRAFYPRHLQVMQQVSWDPNLPSLSQHYDFHVGVQAIFNHAKKMALFHPEDTFTEPEGFSKVEPHLRERDTIRSATFQPHEFGMQAFTTKLDALYPARDVKHGSKRGKRAFRTAVMILRGQTALYSPVLDLKATLLEQHFKDATIKVTNDHMIPYSLRFDSKWLGKSSVLLTDYWCSLHKSLTRGSDLHNKFDIMIWLSTMAYAQSADMSTIQTLGAFYKIPEMKATAIPNATVFHLPHGHTWQNETMRSIAYSHTNLFSSCPEARYPKHRWESNEEHRQRIEARFENRQRHAVQEFVSILENQWPCAELDVSFPTDIGTYINIPDTLQEIRTIFRAWYNNRQFLLYLEDVSARMKSQRVIEIHPSSISTSPPIERRSVDDSSRYFNVNRVLAVERFPMSHERKSCHLASGVFTYCG